MRLVVAPKKAARPARGWDGWRFALGTCVLSIALCFFLSFCLPYVLGLRPQWFMSHDVWTTTNSAQYIANGGFGYVYSANPFFAALPGFLALYAPVVGLGDHLGMITGYPLPLAKPSMWLLTGPFFFVCGSTALLGVDYLAHTLGVSRQRRRVLLVGIAILVVAPTSGLFGHPEDLLALALTCWSLGLVIRRRFPAAAVVLSFAILMQTWAVLVVPALVAATPYGMRLRITLRAVAPPAVVGLVLLAIDFKDAFLDLFKQPMPGIGQHLPWWGMAGHVTIPVGAGIVSVHAGSSSRSLAVVVAVGLGFLVRRRPDARTIMVAVAGALFARGVFETEFWPYYLAPAAVILALLVASTTEGSSKRFAVGCTGAALLYLSAPLSYMGVGFSPWLALTILLATGGVCIGAVLAPDAARRAGGQRAAPPSVAEPALAG